MHPKIVCGTVYQSQRHRGQGEPTSGDQEEPPIRTEGEVHGDETDVVVAKSIQVDLPALQRCVPKR